MSYVERLIAGYRSGLACSGALPPPGVLRRQLAEAVDPLERGALLGLLARAVVLRDAEGTGADNMVVDPAPDEGLAQKVRAGR